MRFRLFLSLCVMACDGAILVPVVHAPDPVPVAPFVLKVPTQIDRHTTLGLRRLDSVEYLNTVRDVLFVDATTLSLPQASLVLGLSNNQHVQQVSRGDLDSYVAAADTVSTQALAFLQLPVGCTQRVFTEACFDQWAPSFFERAFRVGTVDLAPYRALFNSVKAEEGGQEALRAVLQAVLIAPSFLYRFETVNQTGALDDYAIASRLSYLTWSSAPDTQLLAAARAGELQSPDARKAAAQRLLADPRSKDGATHFVGEWLGRVESTGEGRRGILTQPLLIAAHAKESGYSVVQLGRFMRERLLCQTIAPPPPGTDTTLPEDASTAGLGYREKLTKRTENQPCIGCHTMMNPPGFAYLNYDPIGRRLEKDGRGVTIDASGTMAGLQKESLPFTDLAQLADALTATYDVRGCFTQRGIERTFGRTFSKSDAALYTALTEQLMTSHGDFATFITTLAASPELASAGPREP